MASIRRRSRVVTWNGKDVRPELRELPAGRYLVEAVEERRLRSLQRKNLASKRRSNRTAGGRVVDGKLAREIIDAAFGR